LILAVYGRSGDLGCDCHDHHRLVDLLETGGSDAVAAFMQVTFFGAEYHTKKRKTRRKRNC
jgi:hypothetical protein